MKQMIVKENFAFLYLNNQIYSKESILDSLEEYRDFIKSSISNIGKYIIIKIENINTQYSLKELSSEILNHILSNEKTKIGGIN